MTMENALYFVFGATIGFIAMWFIYYIDYVNNKQGEYLKELSDKDFRRYIEYKRKL